MRDDNGLRVAEVSEPSLILEEAPRVLSLVDRQASSPTSGCCDRTYWSWKFVDFPRSRFQEAVCVLSFLHATAFDGNRFMGSEKLLRWIEQGLLFWTELQHRDGSYDEAYPFERSLAATSFTSFYVAEALSFLGDRLPVDVRDRVAQAIERAGRWLCDNDETHGILSNHLAAAAAALQHAYLITGHDGFRARSRYFVDRVLSHQSTEGWYEEYGGADPGYQTHGTFYLARLLQLAPDERLLDSLGRAVTFQAHFVHPDGSLGGEYSSRNTQTYYPAAFEMLAHEHRAASWISDRMRGSVDGSAAAGLRAIDSYNYFPILNNLVFAFLARSSDSHALDSEEPAPDTGLQSSASGDTHQQYWGPGTSSILPTGLQPDFLTTPKSRGVG